MKVKVLLIRPGPSFSVQDVAFGWRDGLREIGVEVADYNHDDRLDFYCSAQMEKDGEVRRAFSHEQGIALAAKGILAAAYEYWPDIVIGVSGMFVPTAVWDLLRSRGHVVVMLGTESPYEDDRQRALAKHVDLMVLNDPTNIEAFRAVNPETYYVPHAYDPVKHHPGPVVPEMKSDVAFVGTGFPSRVEFMESIDWSGLDVLLGGSWSALADDSPLARFVGHRRDWCVDNAEAANIYRSTRSSFNLYRREAAEHGPLDTGEGWSIGPREVELAACETFFLRDPRGEGDALFPMLPTFTEPGEVRDLLDWWLAHDDARDNAAARARAAIAPRTFAANAAWLLQHLT